MKNWTRTIARTARHITHASVTVAHAVGERLRQTWRDHRQRLGTDRAYGAALAGVVVAACELVTRDPRVIAVVGAIATAYITISRAARHGVWDPQDD